MSTLTRWVLSHKLLVVTTWAILSITGFATIQRASGALSEKFSAPGGPGIQTSAAIVQRYGTGGDTSPIVPVITLPARITVTTPGVQAQLVTAFARIAAVVPGARMASYPSTGDRAFVSPDGHTTFALVYYPAAAAYGSNVLSRDLQRIHAALAPVTVDGAHFHVTGIDALDTGAGNSGGHSMLFETLLAGLLALIVLAFVFGSGLAIIPMVTALVAIPTTYLLIWGLASVTDVSFIVQFLIGLIGLGVAIDYSLLIVMRWREELNAGADKDLAIVRAMETAGRSVVFSGATVAIGLLALAVLPVPFLRSVGYGGMLIPLVSVAVALTLLPVVLSRVGPVLDRPRRAGPVTVSRLWTAWASRVVRHPWIAAAAGVLILGILLGAARTISLGNAQADSLARSGDAHVGLVQLERSGIGAGALSPFEVLVQGVPAGTIASRLSAAQGVRGAVAPIAWRHGATSIVDVFPLADPSSPAGSAVLDAVRSATHISSGTVGVGGPVAVNHDLVNAIYGNFPLMIGLIVLLTFVFLVRAFRSLILPLKAVLLNLISVGASWGVMVLIWQDGFVSRALWGIHPTGSITFWVPLMTFAFLFGLSMDYEVFLLSRVRETYDATGSTAGAVVTGVGRVGRLITGAALILFLAFVSMSGIPQTEVKMLATGLAAGILLDATVVRMLLVPALVVLFGRWNWWLPSPIAAVLRVPVRVSEHVSLGRAAE